jgi:PAS domain S-box-containing protein
MENKLDRPQSHEEREVQTLVNRIEKQVSQEAARESQDAREAETKRALRMLIVEDSKDDANLLLHTVRSGGYEPVYEVVDTEPAMRAALESQDWDLITSDHAMPSFSAPVALALAQELRRNVPLIIVSGEIDLNLAVSLMKAGARDYVQKTSLARLVPVIDRVLRDTESYRSQERMQRALQTSETRYRRLFETAQDGILILDADTGRITDVNPFLVKMLGYSREQCLGKKLWELGAFKDTEACESGFVQLQRDQYIRYEDLPLETSDGQSIEVEFVSNVYLVDDQKVIQCNVREITERVHAEAKLRVLNVELEQRVHARTAELEAVNKELGTFNYSVSHDLCAPLRRIRGFVDALEQGYAAKLDSEGQRLIQIIGASAEHMNTLIDALLRLVGFSRDQLKPQATNLSKLVRLIGAELQQSDPTRQVEFVVAEDIMAIGDPAMLRVVMENLLGNAWKFTSKQATARIEFGSVGQGDKVATFVSDNGAGFNMKYADKLFGAFQRFHIQADFPGTGIGLASVQRIVHRHGGRIWAQSTVGRGTTFYFTLNGVAGSDQLDRIEDSLKDRVSSQLAGVGFGVPPAVDV